MRRALLAALLSWACGCGGVAEHSDERRGAGGQSPASGGSLGAGGEHSMALDAGGEAGAAANAGGSVGAADTTGTAGESPAIAAPPVSGRVLCIDDRDCSGLLCTANPGRARSACLAPCASDAECRSDEHCFEPPDLGLSADGAPPARSCFQSCQESPTICAFQFDCVDYYRQDQYVCLPTEWVRNWPASQP